jgi:hypothetical protein
VEQCDKDKIVIGIALGVLKTRIDGPTGFHWPTWVFDNCGIGIRRVNELISMGEGRTLPAEVREEKRKSVSKTRLNQKLSGTTVVPRKAPTPPSTPKTPTPSASIHVFHPKPADPEPEPKPADLESDGMADSTILHEAKGETPLPVLPMYESVSRRQRIVAGLAKIAEGLNEVATNMDNGTLDSDEDFPGTNYHGEAENSWVAYAAATKAYRVETLRICDIVWPEDEPPEGNRETPPDESGEPTPANNTQDAVDAPSDNEGYTELRPDFFKGSPEEQLDSVFETRETNPARTAEYKQALHYGDSVRPAMSMKTMMLGLDLAAPVARPIVAKAAPVVQPTCPTVYPAVRPLTPPKGYIELSKSYADLCGKIHPFFDLANCDQLLAAFENKDNPAMTAEYLKALACGDCEMTRTPWELEHGTWIAAEQARGKSMASEPDPEPPEPDPPKPRGRPKKVKPAADAPPIVEEAISDGAPTTTGGTSMKRDNLKSTRDLQRLKPFDELTPQKQLARIHATRETHPVETAKYLKKLEQGKFTLPPMSYGVASAMDDLGIPMCAADQIEFDAVIKAVVNGDHAPHEALAKFGFKKIDAAVTDAKAALENNSTIN